jgi:hypothetical protein
MNLLPQNVCNRLPRATVIKPGYPDGVTLEVSKGINVDYGGCEFTLPNKRDLNSGEIVRIQFHPAQLMFTSIRVTLTATCDSCSTSFYAVASLLQSIQSCLTGLSSQIKHRLPLRLSRFLSGQGKPARVAFYQEFMVYGLKLHP